MVKSESGFVWYLDVRERERMFTSETIKSSRISFCSAVIA